MPTDMSKIALVREMLDNAESSIRSARQLLSEITGDTEISKESYVEKAKNIPSSSSTGRIIEGVFDGQNMIDSDGNNYPVPANYASKSKLVCGDVLKLTITDEGRFLYKQIGPVERKTVVGPLTYEDGQYKVLANGKAYNVLLASVTYFRAEVGDEVTLIIPGAEDCNWGAIEAVLPKFSDENIEELADLGKTEEEPADKKEENDEEKKKKSKPKKNTKKSTKKKPEKDKLEGDDIDF